MDLLLKGSLQFGNRLAGTAEQNVLRLNSNCQKTKQLTSRDDVEATAQLTQEAQHRKVRISLDRIKETMGQPGEGSTEAVVVGDDFPLAVHVTGCSNCGGNSAQGNIFTVKVSVLVGEGSIIGHGLQFTKGI